MRILQILSLFMIAASLCASKPVFAASNGNFTAKQQAQIQQIVHDYLVNKPQVLIEASQSLQKQQMAELEKNAKQAISSNFSRVVSDPTSLVLGNKNGKVTLVEFLDYQCGHCKAMSPVVENVLKSNPNLRIVVKEFPIFGAGSEFAAGAAIAASKQGIDKATAFHSALFNAKSQLNPDSVMQIAKSVGLDTTKLQNDMKDPAIAKQLQDNLDLAQTLGLVGTPAFIITPTQAFNAAELGFIPGATNEATLQNFINKAQGTATQANNS